MHDIRYIRENPADFDAAMVRRGLSALSSDIIDAPGPFSYHHYSKRF